MAALLFASVAPIAFLSACAPSRSRVPAIPQRKEFMRAVKQGTAMDPEKIAELKSAPPSLHAYGLSAKRR